MRSRRTPTDSLDSGERPKSSRPVNHPNVAHVYGLEPTCVATAAAIMNAIHDAVGVRITSLPATAERVHAALKAKRAQESRQLTA